MSTKGEATRRRVLHRSAVLLNSHGYRNTPIAEIAKEAGLKNASLYRHFESRKALVRQTFALAVSRIRARLIGAVERKNSSTEKLLALLEVARNAPDDELWLGGCPIMNMAIESDDADRTLCDDARAAMSGLRGLIEEVIALGMQQGEFRAGDAREKATLFLASIEGALMLSNLYKDRYQIGVVVDHLTRSVRSGHL